MKRIILCVVLIALLLLSGCTDYRRSYEDLQDKYDDLLARYDNLAGSYEDLQLTYDDLQDRYDALDGKYTDLSAAYENFSGSSADYKSQFESLGTLEEDLTTVWCFFESEENVSFDQAYPAYLHIHNLVHSMIYPDD